MAQIPQAGPEAGSKSHNIQGETDLDHLVEAAEDWAAELAALHQRLAPRFKRAEPRKRVLGYLKGLLSPLERKNGWHLASANSEATPDGVQRLLNAAEWSADEVRDDLRQYVVEHLGGSQAGSVVVIDETGFIKKGTKSVGVKRQYSGTAGRVENCQVGVFLTYSAAGKGRCLIDRELYLPGEWAADVGRRKEAGVPEEVEFATKPQLAIKMLERTLAAETGVKAEWVTADSVYGGDRHLRNWLEQHHQPFAMAVPTNEPLWYDLHDGRGPGQVRADHITASLDQAQWQRLSCGAGSKGPRFYEWVRAELFRLPAPGVGHWLLVRRNLNEPGELAYYVVFGPASTSLQELVQVVGQRWTIEESFELAKDELGLDQYEVRKWQSWYRYITLVMVAQAYLTVIRYQAARREAAQEKKETRTSTR